MEFLAVNAFVLLILVPSLFFRFGFALLADLTNKKINLYDNFRYFFFPSSIISFFCYLNWESSIGKYLEPLIFKLNTIEKVDIKQSLFALFVISFFSVLGGLVTGLVFKLYLESRKHEILIGDDIFSVSWLTVFKKLLSLEHTVYVKMKSGEIYRGNLRHFSLDANHDLEVVCLSDCIRRIYQYEKKGEKLEFGSSSVDLSQGLMVVRADEIENIWFQNSYLVADFKTSPDELLKIISDTVKEEVK